MCIPYGNLTNLKTTKSQISSGIAGGLLIETVYVFEFAAKALLPNKFILS